MADEEESEGTTEETKETKETKTTEAKDATVDKETEETETIADRHDQPGVNREMFEREVKSAMQRSRNSKANLMKRQRPKKGMKISRKRSRSLRSQVLTKEESHPRMRGIPQ